MPEPNRNSVVDASRKIGRNPESFLMFGVDGRFKFCWSSPYCQDDDGTPSIVELGRSVVLFVQQNWSNRRQRSVIVSITLAADGKTLRADFWKPGDNGPRVTIEFDQIFVRSKDLSALWKKEGSRDADSELEKEVRKLKIIIAAQNSMIKESVCGNCSKITEKIGKMESNASIAKYIVGLIKAKRVTVGGLGDTKIRGIFSDSDKVFESSLVRSKALSRS